MNDHSKTLRLTRLALLAAIVLVLAYTPLGYIHIGPLAITPIMIPVTVGAILLGPTEGAILGGIFGLTSFSTCFGSDAFGTMLMSINPVFTFLTCVPTRVLAGWLPAVIFKALYRKEQPLRANTAFGVAALAGPVLNTVFFMGALVLFFYRTDYIQGFVTALGAANPLLFTTQTRVFRRRRARAIFFRGIFDNPAALRPELVWEFFQGVNNVGGPASCQSMPETFSAMRRAQYAAWSPEAVASWYDDLFTYERMGANPLAFKYGYMMEATHPDEFDRIKDMLPDVSPEKRSLIDRALLVQVGVYFLFPLVVAVAHAAVALSVVNDIVALLTGYQIGTALVGTVCFVVVLYGGYFLVTYLTSRSMVARSGGGAPSRA